MKQQTLAILAAGAILTLLCLWPAWLHPLSHVPGDIGDPLLNTWILAWDAHALLSGLSVWDANMYYPLPGTLAYTEHLLGLAVLGLPLQAFGEPLLAYNALLWGSFCLAFLGAYLLALHLWRNRWAAPIAGVVFAFGPYRLALLSHLQLLAVQWLPLSVLMLDRAWRRPTRARLLALSGFALLQVGVGWYVAVFWAATVALWAGGSLLTRRWRTSRGSWPMLLPLTVTVGALMLLARPYAAALPELREQRSLQEARAFSFGLVDVITAVPQNLVWGRASVALRQRPEYNGEHALFLGLAACGAAGAGAVAGLRSSGERRTTTVTIGVLTVCLVLAAGPDAAVAGRRLPLPWGVMTELLPPLQGLRVHARWFVPATLGLALLAGRAVSGPRSGALLATLCLLEGLSLPVPLAQVGSLSSLPEAYRELARAAPPGAVLELPMWVAPAPEYPEAKRLYASSLHWRPLVNGYSSITPPRQRELEERLIAFPDEASLTHLREMAGQGLAFLVAHPGERELSADSWEAELRWRLSSRPELRLVAVSPGAWLYRVYSEGPAELRSGGSAPGQMHPWARSFANGADLLGYRWEAQGPFGPTLTLFWECLEPPEGDWTVFVHFLDEAGSIVAQADGDPVHGRYPISEWREGEVVRDERLLQVSGSSVGRAAVGWYHRQTGERALLWGGDGKDAVLLTLD